MQPEPFQQSDVNDAFVQNLVEYHVQDSESEAHRPYAISWPTEVDSSYVHSQQELYKPEIGHNDLLRN